MYFLCLQNDCFFLTLYLQFHLLFSRLLYLHVLVVLSLVYNTYVFSKSTCSFRLHFTITSVLKIMRFKQPSVRWSSILGNKSKHDFIKLILENKKSKIRAGSKNKDVIDWIGILFSLDWFSLCYGLHNNAETGSDQRSLITKPPLALHYWNVTPIKYSCRDMAKVHVI